VAQIGAAQIASREIRAVQDRMAQRSGRQIGEPESAKVGATRILQPFERLRAAGTAQDAAPPPLLEPGKMGGHDAVQLSRPRGGYGLRLPPHSVHWRLDPLFHDPSRGAVPSIRAEAASGRPIVIDETAYQRCRRDGKGAR
jgi:hypothetical protein